MRFDWVWWFQVAAVFTLNFWVYGFDLLEDLVEERDFE